MNKVLISHYKKYIVASVVDLFLMEALRKFEFVSLSAMMIEHMHRFMHIKDGKHRVPYGYLLNKVFKYFHIECVKGVTGIVKKIFTMNTLIENECVQGRVGTSS